MAIYFRDQQSRFYNKPSFYVKCAFVIAACALALLFYSEPTDGVRLIRGPRIGPRVRMGPRIRLDNEMYENGYGGGYGYGNGYGGYQTREEMDERHENAYGRGYGRSVLGIGTIIGIVVVIIVVIVVIAIVAICCLRNRF